MPKTLLSFLGTGPLIRDKENPQREYKKARYKIDDSFYETSFVSAAIAQHIRCDKKIIVGTVKSMWEEYYRYFVEGTEAFDENLFWELVNFQDKANHLTEDFPFKAQLEKALENTHIIILKYGINESELNENLLSILRVDDFLGQDDELYVDVTHGFRSFPIFANQVVMYLNKVSSKNIKVQKLYYGMLDIMRELDYAPVVDLSSVLKLNEWILGASELINKSDGYALEQLLKERDSELAKVVGNFSNAMNLNYSHEIRKQYERLLKADFSHLSPQEVLIAEKAFNEFKASFDLSKKHSLFQLDLAFWYYRKRFYGVSYLTLTEAIVTYIAEDINPLNPLENSVRDQAKKEIHKRNVELAHLFTTVNKIRKNVAHMLDKRHDTYLNDIQNLEKRLKKAKSLMK